MTAFGIKSWIVCLTMPKYDVMSDRIKFISISSLRLSCEPPSDEV